MQRNFHLGRGTTTLHILVFVLWGRKCLGLWGSFSISAFSPWATVSKIFPLHHVADDTDLLSRMPEDQLLKCSRSEAELVK